MRMLGVPLFSHFEPQWNVSPTAILNAVVSENFQDDAPLNSTNMRLNTTQMRWGIKAPWATQSTHVRPLINARSETLFSKPTFRDLAKAHRAIVPVTGFYEWERHDDRRIPYYVQVKDMPAMLLATVFQPVTQADIDNERLNKAAKLAKPPSPQMGFSFDEPMPANDEPSSAVASDSTQERTILPNPSGNTKATTNFTGDFAVVTTEATGELAAIHHRTPVMLNTEQAKRWIHTEDPAELEAMMAPDAVMNVRLTEVSEAVNSSRNNGPECVQPLRRSK